MTIIHLNYAGAKLHTTGAYRSVRALAYGPGDFAADFHDGKQVDGVNLVTDDTLALTAQTDATQNGLHRVNASGAPTRLTDFDDPLDLPYGLPVYVEEGTAYGQHVWLHTTPAPIEVDVTPITFVLDMRGHMLQPGAHEASAVHYDSPGGVDPNVDAALEDLDAHVAGLAASENAVLTGVTQFSDGLALSGWQTVTLSADTNNLQPTNYNVTTNWRLNPTVDLFITGLFTPSGPAGRMLFLENAGDFTVTLSPEDGGSDATNRFGFLSNLILPPAACVLLRYEPAVGRWLAIVTSLSSVEAASASLASLRITGRVGADLPFRLVGSVATGVPTSGAFETGDVVLRADSSTLAFAAASGSPGAWSPATLPGDEVPTGPKRFLTTLTAAAVDTGGVAPTLNSTPAWNDDFGDPSDPTIPVTGRYRVQVVPQVAASTGTLSVAGLLTWEGIGWVLPAGLSTTPVSLVASSAKTGPQPATNPLGLGDPIVFDNGTAETVDVVLTVLVEQVSAALAA